jgi:hypothetical protein
MADTEEQPKEVVQPEEEQEEKPAAASSSEEKEGGADPSAAPSSSDPAQPKQPKALYFVRIPRPHVDDGPVKELQTELSATLAKLKEQNAKLAAKRVRAYFSWRKRVQRAQHGRVVGRSSFFSVTMEEYMYLLVTPPTPRNK